MNSNTIDSSTDWAANPDSVEIPVFGRSPIEQPYRYVSSGAFDEEVICYSSDPLVHYRWPCPKASDDLEIYLLRPEVVTTDTASSFENLDSLFVASPNVKVLGEGTIRVDFGRENAAWLEIDSDDCPGGIELSVSEYNEPQYTNVGDKTIVPERIGNTYRAKLNDEFYEGVRFGFVHVRSFSKVWHITGIRLVCQIKPTNYEGSFVSDDDVLNRIWHMCAYSVKLCNLKDFTTPILVARGDRYLWNGLDFYICNTANLIAFKNYEFVKQQLTKVNTPPGVNAGIPSFELYDVISVCDFYNYSGDEGFLKDCYQISCEKLDRAKELYKDGKLFFMGWDERLGGFELVTSFNRWNYRMLCIRAWRQFAVAAYRQGDSACRDKYNGFANEAIRELRLDPTWHLQMDVHGCAEAIQAGFCTQAEIDAIYAVEFSDRVNRVSYSQANTGLILQAMALAGFHDDALCTLKDQWGGVLEYGGTTTFEMFNPSWVDVLGKNDPVVNGQCGMTSLCHPWGALPCKYLNEEVLGIKPLTPGFERVEVFPHLGTKLSQVAGVTPTLKGDIRASFDITSGLCSVEFPPGVNGTIGIPKVGRQINSIAVNGQLAWNGGAQSVSGIEGVKEGADFVSFEGVPPGRYEFSVSYAGSTPSFQDPEKFYPIQLVSEDSVTQGNWGGVYGSDGYVLPNYDGIGHDVRVLPSYVSSLILDPERCENLTWAENVEDPRAPSRTSRNVGPRSAAAVYTKDPEPTYQTMFVDITVVDKREFTMALYFLDWDTKTRRVGVQIIDPVTLKQLAPVAIVDDYHEGKYLAYRCERSVRVRIDTIKSPNATLSGIFFSS